MIEVSLNFGSHFGSTWITVHVCGLLWNAFLRFVQLFGANLEVWGPTWAQLGRLGIAFWADLVFRRSIVLQSLKMIPQRSTLPYI